MKGFLKRDLYFLAINGKFYLCFLAVMAVLAFFTDFSAGFLYLYAMIFCVSDVVSLFGYDEANHWGGYAAAVPQGRRAQVDARYLAGLVVTGVSAAVMLPASLPDRQAGGWALALLYGGLGLVYLAILCPLQYYFGNRSRLVLIILIAAVAGTFGAMGGIGMISGGVRSGQSPMAAALPLIAVGVIGLAVSRQISLRIVEKKEY